MFALPLHITPRLERYATWLGRNTLNPAALAASSPSARWYSCFSISKLLIRERIERDLGEQLSIQEVLSSPSAPGWTCGSRVFPFWYWWILCDFFCQIPCYVIPISLHFGPRLSPRCWYFWPGSSGSYVEDMYEAWAHDPSSVHASWDAYFRFSHTKKNLLGIMMLIQRRSLPGATILGQHHTPQWDCPCLPWRRSAWCGRWST